MIAIALNDVRMYFFLSLHVKILFLTNKLICGQRARQFLKTLTSPFWHGLASDVPIDLFHLNDLVFPNATKKKMHLGDM